MRFFKDFAVSVLAIALTLLALEGVLRLAGLRFEASLYTEERERGYALRPEAQGWSTLESDVYVHINRDGMRDRERTVIAPPNTLRIAVIGSSEVDARQVALPDTFEAIMERDLTRDLKSKCRNVEVLNFGVPGYGLSQEYLTLRDHVWKYHPQIVVLAEMANVMVRNVRKQYPLPTRGIPFYLLDHGTLVADPETRLAPPINVRRVRWKNRIADLMNWSEVLTIGNEALRIQGPEIVARMKARFSRKAGAAANRSAAAEQISKRTYLPGFPQTQESWRIGDALLKAMNEDCDGHAAEFWIVVIGTPMEVHPDLRVRMALARQLGISTLEESDEGLEKLAERDGIHAVLLAPAMGSYAASHHMALHGFAKTAFNDGHWNEAGHRVAADLITTELTRSSAVIAKLQ